MKGDLIEYWPDNGRILIKKAESHGKTASGIIIPDQAKKELNYGTVTRVADGSKYHKGDVVIFGKYAGVDIELALDGAEKPNEYLIIQETEVMGLTVIRE